MTIKAETTTTGLQEWLVAKKSKTNSRGFFPDQHTGQIVYQQQQQQQQQQGDSVNLLPIFLDRALAQVASD